MAADNTNPFSKAISDRRKSLEAAQRASKPGEKKAAGVDGGDTVGFFTDANGVVRPISPASGGKNLFKNPGEKFYRDPVDNTPYKIDRAHPSGLKNAWNDVPVTPKSGRLTQTLPGYGTRDIGPDPAAEAKAAEKQQKTEAKASSDAQKAQEKASKQAVADEEAETKRQQKIGRAGIGAAKKNVAQVEDQFISLSRQARENAAMNKADLEYDKRQVSSLDKQLRDERDPAKRKDIEAQKAKIAETLPAKEKRQHELDLETHRAVLRQEQWRSEGRPAALDAINRESERVNLMTNTGRRGALEGPPVAAKPVEKKPNPTDGFREQPDGGKPMLLPGMKLLPNGKKAMDGLAEFDQINQAMMAKEGTVRIEAPHGSNWGVQPAPLNQLPDQRGHVQPWMSDEAMLAVKTAREVGKLDFHLPDGFEKTKADGGWMDAGASRNEEVTFNGQPVGTVKRNAFGIPTLTMQRGGRSPSLASGNPYDGVPEYADVHPDFAQRLKKSSVPGADVSTDDDIRGEWEARRWDTGTVKGFIDRWRGANDAERGDILNEIQPELAGDIKAWREGRAGAKMPVLDTRALYESGQITRQEARQIEREFYNAPPISTDYDQQWQTFLAGDSPAAKAVRAEQHATGNVRRYASAIDAAASQFISETFGKDRSRVDYDPAAFAAWAKTTAKDTKGYYTRLADTLDAGAQSGVGSSLGAIYGVAIRAPLTVIKGAGQVVGLGKIEGDLDAAKAAEHSGNGAFSWNEIDLIMEQTGESAKGMWNFLRDRATTDLTAMWSGKEGKTLTKAIGELTDKAGADNLTREDLDRLASELQSTALKLNNQDAEQAAWYDVRNPDSPAGRALAAYQATRDPVFIDRLRQELTMSPRKSYLQDAVSAYASANGLIAEDGTFGRLQQGWRGAQTSAMQEQAVETLSGGVEAVAGHLLMKGTKAAARATEAGKAMTWANKAALRAEEIGDWFHNVGMKPGADFRNTLVQGAKVGAVGFVTEGLEGVPTSMDTGGTIGDVIDGFVQEGLGALGMAPVMAVGGMVSNAVVEANAARKDTIAVNRYVDGWNERNPDDTMTADDWRQARSYLPQERSVELQQKAANAMVTIAAGKAATAELERGEATPERVAALQKIVADGQLAAIDLTIATEEQRAHVIEAREAMQEVNGIDDPVLHQFADAALKSVRGLPLTENEQAALERAVAGVPAGPVMPPQPALDKNGKPIKDLPTPPMPGVPLAKRQKDGSYIITDAGLAELGKAIPRTRELMLPVDERSQIVPQVPRGTANGQQPGAAAAPVSPSPNAAGTNPSPNLNQPGTVNPSPAESSAGTQRGPTSVAAPGTYTVPVTITAPSGQSRVQEVEVQAGSPAEAKQAVEVMPQWKAFAARGAAISVGEGALVGDNTSNGQQPDTTTGNASNGSAAEAGTTTGNEAGRTGEVGPTAGAESAGEATGGRGLSQEVSEADWHAQAEAARQQVKPLAEVLKNAVAAFGYKIVDTGLPFGFTDRYGTFHSFGTQIIDKAIPGSTLGQWIDHITNSPAADAIREGMSKPYFHRVWFGHDPLANVATIVNKFGIGALPEYGIQLLKDMTTKSGIPLPGVQWLVHAGVIGDKAATEWLSLNVGEALGAGFGILGTYRLYKRAKAAGREIPAGWAILGIGFKLVGGVLSANPLLLLSGAADTAILVGAKQGWIKAGLQKAHEIGNTTSATGSRRGADGPQSTAGQRAAPAAGAQQQVGAADETAPPATTGARGPDSRGGNPVRGTRTGAGAAAPSQPGGATAPPGNARRAAESLKYLQQVPQVEAVKAVSALPKNQHARGIELIGRLDRVLDQFGGLFAGGVTFVTDNEAAMQVRRNEQGEPMLVVNVPQFLVDFRDTQSLSAVQATIEEEITHAAALAALGDNEVIGLWNSLTPELRQTVWHAYNVARIAEGSMSEQVPADLDEVTQWQMGHEFVRMLVQDSEFAGRVTEAIDASPSLGERLIQFLQKFVGELRRLIGTVEDPEVRARIEEYEARVKTKLREMMSGGGNVRVEMQGGGRTVVSDQSSVFSGELPGAVMGSEGTAYTEGNEPIGFRWAAVEAGDLTISNTDDGRINPDYPAELQPRDRTSAASEAQVNDIAANSNLDRLSHSNGVGDGAPFVGPDGVVESGNGRAMGLSRAYGRGMVSIDTYRQNLMARAGEFGLDPQAIAGMKQPVLVRVRTTNVDRAAFAQAANVSNIAPMREVEVAKKDAGNLTPDFFETFQPSADGDIFTASNADFIRGFIKGIVPQTERGALVDRNGNLTQTGLRRVRNAIFAYAYGTTTESLNALGSLTEDIDPANRSITNALVSAAPIFAEQNARMAAGALQPVSLTDDLVRALTIYQGIRARGETVADYLAQEQMPGMGDERNALVDDLLGWMEANKRSGARMFDTLRRYAQAVENAGDPRQGQMFGGGETVTKEGLWKQVAEEESVQSSVGSIQSQAPAGAEVDPATAKAISYQESVLKDPKATPEKKAKARKMLDMLRNPSGALSIARRVSGLAEDLTAQAEWLDANARQRGFAGADEMAMRNPEGVMQLARAWRAAHPNARDEGGRRQEQRAPLSMASRGGYKFTQIKAAVDKYPAEVRAALEDFLVNERDMPPSNAAVEALVKEALTQYEAWLAPRMEALRPAWQAYRAEFTAEIQDKFNRTLDGIAEQTGTVPMTGVPLKGDRGMEKAILDAGLAGQPDVATVKDVLRASIIGTTDAEVDAVVAAIKAAYPQHKHKDRFANPLGGYRDHLFQVKLPNGRMAEVQVHRADYIALKQEGAGHAIYEIRRRLSDALNFFGIQGVSAPRALFSQLDRVVDPFMVRFYTDGGSIARNVGRSITPPSENTSDIGYGRPAGASVPQVQVPGSMPAASATSSGTLATGRSLTSKNSVPSGSDLGSGAFITSDNTSEMRKNQRVSITPANIAEYAGDVDVSTLARLEGAMARAFEMPAGAQVMPLDKLVSHKNELEDPKFLAGKKKDPRQNAADWIVKAIKGEEGAKRRAPLDVTDNGDGTYTIEDGNATAQALMLAGWKGVPVVVKSVEQGAGSREQTLAMAKRRTMQDTDTGDLFAFAESNQGLNLLDVLTPKQQAEKKAEKPVTVDQGDLFAPKSNNPGPGDQAGNGVVSGAGTSAKPTGTRSIAPAAGENIVPQSKPAASGKAEASKRLANEVAKILKGVSRFKKLTWETLFKLADDAFGGTQTNGSYSVKDAYDAMEMGVNQELRRFTSTGGAVNYNPAFQSAQDAIQTIGFIKRVMAEIPTQTKRTQETDDFQQFSTVPPLAFVANWVAGVNAGDVMLEPSSGPGGLAVFSKNAGATVIGNELSPRRAALAKVSGIFDQVFTEDAEQIDNILPADIQPTVVVMNPPFSNAATRGVQGKTATAGRHIEQALQRLQPGGRLVAIVGEGMAWDRPAFRGWWQKIAKDYTVRANIQVNGAEYAKYGTTWDNQIVVIDKVKPAAAHYSPITGRVEKVEELPALLQTIRNERPAVSPGLAPAPRGGGSASGTRADVLRNPGGRDGGVSDAGSAGANPAGERVDGSTGQDQQPAGSSQTGDAVVSAPGRDNGQAGGPAGAQDRGGVNATEELTDAVYDAYNPQVSFPGAHFAPTPLAESAAMAAVAAPETTYRPAIPERIYNDPNRDPEDQRLSAHALESIALAGASHQQMIPAPVMTEREKQDWRKDYGEEPPEEFRRGFFIGDGTGAGKGRQGAGLFLDNWLQGRQKGLWITEKPGLMKDATRDLRDVTGGEYNLDKELFLLGGSLSVKEKLDRKKGIAFTSYATLRGEEKNPEAGKLPRSRVDQIVDWLGKDFDGVILFDESHNMANVVPVKGARGNKEPSQQALVGVQLQRRLPKARVVYLSATGATEVENLGYAERMGLWGPGTPFSNVFNFISKVGQGGVAAMELIAQNVKAMGLYVARSLSWAPVTYGELEHQLTEEQRQMYDTLAEAWQTALKEMHKAMELTGITGTDDQGDTTTNDAKKKGSVLGKFWGAHQRFFAQIITTLKMPTVLKQIEAELGKGHSIVLQLVNTQAAGAERQAAKEAQRAAENGEELDLDTLDLTPREELMEMVMRTFPVIQMEEATSTDAQGNTYTYMRPVKDSQGNLVENKQAVAMREALLEKLSAVRVPNGPLEILTDHFGTEKLAEITGRGRRLVWMKDKKTGEMKREWEKRSDKHTQNEIREFQDGKRRILVFSKKGGTGESFHADRRAKNQQKRVHFLLQPGWQASAAVQGFGRTHRNNQVVAPHYILARTDVKGEKRFISSIARRLDQLGALTKGQRQTGSQGFFDARDNLESQQATEALQWFYREAMAGRIDGISPDVLEEQMGLKMRDKDGAMLSNLPDIKKFLNRILSLSLDMQDKVFDAFASRLDDIVESQRAAGTLDVGMETIKALHTKELGREEVYRDDKTGAKADLVELELTQPNTFRKFEHSSYSGERFQVNPYVRNKRTGKIGVMTNRYESIKADGMTVDQILVDGPVRNKWVDVDKLWNLYDRVEGDIASARAEAAKNWQEQIDKAGPTHTEKLHLLVGTMLPIWDKIPGRPRVKRAQTDEGQRMIGREIYPDSINDLLTALGKGGRAVTTADAIQAVQRGGSARLSNGWLVKTKSVSGESRVELIGPSFADHATLDTAGAFRERIQFQMRYFLPRDRAAEVLGKLLQMTNATVTEAGGGNASLSMASRAPGAMPKASKQPVNGTAQFVKAQAEGAQSQATQEEQEKQKRLPNKVAAAGVAGVKREVSEAWANVVSGNIDRLDYYAPGFRDIWLDSERKLGLARAAVNGVMEKLHARAKAGFGYPAWWKNPAVFKQWKKFQAELLPVAARLEVEAINPDGSFAWKPFDMRAGDIDLRKVQNLGKKAGDVINVNGEPLIIGRLFEETAHSFTSAGTVVKKHMLLRPMSAAAQQQVYDAFLNEYATFPVARELLDEFIMPGMAGARETGPRGVRTAAFNRYSLLDFFNEWPPELQQLFGPNPLPQVKQIEGYTPDLFTLRGLSFMIAGLAKAFRSGARQVKTGAARESGNVQNLMEGFQTRLMEAHREKIMLERRTRVINAAAKPMKSVPDAEKHKWLPLNDAFKKLYELAVVAKNLDRTRYPKITGALSPDQEAMMRQLVGEAWQLRGRNLAVPEAIYKDMVGEMAVRDAENLLLKVAEWFIDRFNSASLASAGFVAMNWLGNEIMKTSYMAAQGFKAGALLAVGEGKRARLAFDTLSHMVRGMVVDRFPLRQQRIRDIVPRELFDNDQALKALKGFGETIGDSLKNLNVGGAILAAMKAGNWDVGAKVQLAHAAYRAHMLAAWREAGKPGKTKADREAWMKQWLETSAPDTMHREVQLAAGLYLMDYQNVPRWMDANSLRPVVTDPDHPARGVILNQAMRLGIKTMIPFIRWQYSFAKAAKRMGWDGGLRQLLAPSSDKASRAEAAGNLAALGMMVFLPALITALGEGGGDDDDKIQAELIGRVQDLEGGKLPQTLSAKNRINVSALARIFATRLGMDGIDFTVNDAAGDESDLWLRYRNYPYIKEGIVLGLLGSGKREAFGDSWTSLFQEYTSLGIAWQVAETVFGARDNFGEPAAQLGGLGADILTAPVLPHRMVRDVTTLVDPTDRRLTKSKSLGYTPGVVEGIKSRLPWMRDDLPVAGNIKPPGQVSGRTSATPEQVAEVSKAFGIDPAGVTYDRGVKRDTFADLMKLRQLGGSKADVKVSTDDKGRQVVAYPDPATVRKKDRTFEAIRSLSAANLLPIKRQSYREAVLGRKKE